MTDRVNPPFENFAFTIVQDGEQRRCLRLALREDGAFDVHAEKGSAARPQTESDTVLAADRIQRFKDALDRLGVFGWDDQFPSDAARPNVRWTLACVFKRDVFSVASRGGNAVPAEFDDLLEELYQLGLPRPARGQRAGRAGGAGAGAAGSAAGLPFDLSALTGGLQGASPEDMQAALKDMMDNPGEMRNRMREEFRSMSPGQREQLIDALTATGAAPRSFWEQFFNGL